MFVSSTPEHDNMKWWQNLSDVPAETGNRQVSFSVLNNSTRGVL
jgi:hypothetical protein